MKFGIYDRVERGRVKRYPTALLLDYLKRFMSNLVVFRLQLIRMKYGEANVGNTSDTKWCYGKDYKKIPNK